MATERKSTIIDVVGFTTERLMELKKLAGVSGDIIEIDGVTIIPVSMVSLGFAGGGADVNDNKKGKSKNPAGTGAGITDTPQGFLVIKDGAVSFLPVTDGKKTVAGDIISTVVTEAKTIITEAKLKKENKEKGQS